MEELIDVDMSMLDPNLFEVPDDFIISSIPSQQSSSSAASCSQVAGKWPCSDGCTLHSP
jgi:hypothetical protein